MSFSKPLALAGAATILLVGVAFAADRALVADPSTQSTDDAYVTADFTTVAPKVAGRIDRVLVEDNQSVTPGQPLAHIEDADYRAALDMARGETAAAQGAVAELQAQIAQQGTAIAAAQASVKADAATLTFARQNQARYSHLAEGGASPVELRQGAEAHAAEVDANHLRDMANLAGAQRQIAVLQAQLLKARGTLLRAQAAQKQAQLNLSYTTIPAPVAGIVGARGLRVGAYVTAGSGVMAVVPTQTAYVLANFQETQLTHIRPGQKALIHVDTFPGVALRAHVDSLAPASDVAFSPIRPDNATGNFTKVIQRIPVKLVIEPGQALAGQIRVGMSVEADVDTHTRAAEAPYAAR